MVPGRDQPGILSLARVLSSSRTCIFAGAGGASVCVTSDGAFYNPAAFDVLLLLLLLSNNMPNTLFTCTWGLVVVLKCGELRMVYCIRGDLLVTAPRGCPRDQDLKLNLGSQTSDPVCFSTTLSARVPPSLCSWVRAESVAYTLECHSSGRFVFSQS